MLIKWDQEKETQMSQLVFLKLINSEFLILNFFSFHEDLTRNENN